MIRVENEKDTNSSFIRFSFLSVSGQTPNYYLNPDRIYLNNEEATVKRIRSHPSLAYYVSSNESTEVAEAKDLIMKLDGTLGYQMQSEVKRTQTVLK